MSGQINRGSLFGEHIYNICLKKDVTNIVEIGTWNGQGTTKCVMDAVLNKFDNSKLYSLESNLEMHNLAKNYWEGALLPYNCIVKDKLLLIYGRIIEQNEIMSLEFIKNQIGYQEVWNSWHEQDLKNLNNTENVIRLLPEKIDFLILDGGEFTTLAEFNILKDRCRFIACDDTRELKCREIRKYLLQNSNYVCIDDNLFEKNGFCIFERK